jgi:ABC-type nitrate/sulfonate/bicarbonate transport system substrate-binding protein
MRLNEYFENAKGTGVLVTADADGKVNAAIYARPHFLDVNDDETIAFIMADRLSHANVQANPHAAFLFLEEAKGYVGKRLTLRRIKEETDPEKIQSIRRRQRPCECEEGSTRFLVYFHVDGVRPLIGTG